MAMFTPDAYNKYNKNVRIGNWVEEAALGELTGSERRPNEKGIALRTTEHLEQLLSKDYISNTHATHVDPMLNKEYLPINRNPPREKLQDQTMVNTAKTLESTHRAHFQGYDRSAFAKNIRRTQDLIPTKLDPQLMSEYDLRLLPPKMTDDEINKSIPKGNLITSVPVTVYSQRLAEHLHSGTMCDLFNPLLKSSKVSNDYNDGTKSHCYHVDFKKQYHTGTLDHPTHYAGSELTVKPLIEAYRDKFLDIAGPSGLRGIVTKFISLDNANNNLMNRTTFHTALIDLGVCPHQSDVQVFFAELDPNRTGFINYFKFFDLFMKPMNQYRQNALEKTFNFLDQDHLGYLSLSTIINRFKPYQYFSIKEGKEFPSRVLNDFKSTWNVEDPEKVTLDDFMNYFCSLSFIIREDQKFIDNLYNIFNIPPPQPPSKRRLHIYDLKKQPHLFEFVDSDNIGTDPILIQAYLRKKYGFVDMDFVKVIE